MTSHTRRLYHENPYQTTFNATVIAILPEYKLPSESSSSSSQQTTKKLQQSAATGFGVVLDQTAFYPNSGGQLNDIGFMTIAGTRFNVVNVILEEPVGRIVHIIQQGGHHHNDDSNNNNNNNNNHNNSTTTTTVTENSPVQGEIDWMTRLDHLQQHHGQHILSAVFVKVAGIETASFHMNKKISYIDLNSADVSEELIAQVQQQVNEIILAKHPVQTSFHTLEEAKNLNLRRELDAAVIQEPVRIVKIGDNVDIQPCCGTHPHDSSEVGSLVILSTEKMKKMTRLSFICGVRVTQYATSSAQTLKRMALKLGCSSDNVEQALATSMDSSSHVRKQLSDTEKLLIQKVAAEIYTVDGCDTQASNNTFKICVKIMDGDMAILGNLGHMRSIAKEPVFVSKCIVALLSPVESSNSVNFIVSASDDLVKDKVVDLRNWVKEMFRKCSGKGGGAPAMVQGSFSGTTDAKRLHDEICESFKSL